VGVVSHVVPDQGALEKQILVRPGVDFSRLAEVLVVLSNEVTSAPQQ
jgi:cell shape-determining protein MreC